jgi:hypothetical protein
LEDLACRVLSIFELVYDHGNTTFAKLRMSAELISNLARLEIVVDHTVLVVFVNEEQRRLIVVEHDVCGLHNVASLVSDDGQMHQILEPALVVYIVIFTILVNLDDGAIDDESPVVGHSLKTFTILAISERRLQVFIEARLLIFDSFLSVVEVIDILLMEEVVVLIVMLVHILMIHLRPVLHINVCSITYNLRLQPSVIDVGFFLTLQRACRLV